MPPAFPPAAAATARRRRSPRESPSPNMSFAIAAIPSPIGPAPVTTIDCGSGCTSRARRIAWPFVPIMSSSRVASVNGISPSMGKKMFSCHQFIRPVAAVLVEPHVRALGQALVRQAQPAVPALAAEIHQEHHARRAAPACARRPCRHDDPRRLMARRNGCALVKLPTLGTAQGVRPDLQQQLAGTGPGHGLLGHSDLSLARKLRRHHCRGQMKFGHCCVLLFLCARSIIVPEAQRVRGASGTIMPFDVWSTPIRTRRA